MRSKIPRRRLVYCQFGIGDYMGHPQTERYAVRGLEAGKALATFLHYGVKSTHELD